MKVFLSTKADRQLRVFPSVMYLHIIEKIEHLGTDPYSVNAKKLAGREGWRMRVGDYRILYMVNTKKKEITILSVAHRKDAYRR